MTGDDALAKAQLVRENLEQLAAIPQTTPADFESDFRNVQSALHLLQTSIQALIDIGSYRCAALGLRTPTSSHEVFERLEAAGRLPVGSAARAAPIVGFRNRVVHLYDRIDSRIVYRIVSGPPAIRRSRGGATCRARPSGAAPAEPGRSVSPSGSTRSATGTWSRRSPTACGGANASSRSAAAATSSCSSRHCVRRSPG